MEEIIELTVKVKINFEDKSRRKETIAQAKECVLSTSILGSNGVKPISSKLFNRKKVDDKAETINRLLIEKVEIRQALADYIKSEGCGCCGNREPHEEASARLGKLLDVEPYSDGSGFNFYAYCSTK